MIQYDRRLVEEQKKRYKKIDRVKDYFVLFVMFLLALSIFLIILSWVITFVGGYWDGRIV